LRSNTRKTPWLGFAVGVGVMVGNLFSTPGFGRSACPRFRLIDLPGRQRWGQFDLLVVKLAPSGSLVYSTYLGGDNTEWPGAIEADAQGNAYLTGSTYSANFPLARQLAMPKPNVYRTQAFVTKLSPDGSAFVYSSGEGIAVDGFVTKIRISTVFNRPPDCSAAIANPSSIWPRDRRQVQISILGATDPDGDPVALRVTRIFQDELSTVQ
jgi:hypothetical protein